MNLFIEAVEVVIESQCDVYGHEKMVSIANSSGWDIDDSLKLVSVAAPETSFKNFLQNIKSALGNTALVGSKLALIRFISKKEQGGLRLESGTREYFMKEIFG